ncbi:DUF3231 family protein [Paenibacillus albilobatus]|nr:DUF3231 family protein [Paenibacillus albilobatus]
MLTALVLYPQGLCDDYIQDIDMFSMKVREYANGASLSGRKDVGALFAKCQLDVSLYVEDGANIMIDRGWMEQPPEAVDRDNLHAGH